MQPRPARRAIWIGPVLKPDRSRGHRTLHPRVERSRILKSTFRSASQNHSASRPMAWLAALLLAVFHCVAVAADSLVQHPAGITAFVAVNVVPMDRERVFATKPSSIEGRQDRGDRVVPCPRAAGMRRVIDGRGTAFPLARARRHAYACGNAQRPRRLSRQRRDDRAATWARREPIHGQIARPINRGSVPGPHVYTSFLVDGSPRLRTLRT